ncbi:keratin, type I cytoskeletal 9 [Lingula anatina]|uniref:Keratin, type I cytoskeletal 9 n=1 Tax=Lingula anatina TaxID=7574 RepID=A0A1S3HP96_LINAN|nr:keratin, type I cytoskeletal 9 [Lingula anatina]|eukprot:XP_013387867.1 keratin, type I cytoskeletal 9 [Lingula anatina]
MYSNMYLLVIVALLFSCLENGASQTTTVATRLAKDPYKNLEDVLASKVHHRVVSQYIAKFTQALVKYCPESINYHWWDVMAMWRRMSKRDAPSSDQLMLEAGVSALRELVSIYENCTVKGFRNMTFTNLGATGRLGPTSVGKYYDGQDHQGKVTLVNGTQFFTIPVSGLYRIRAAGAAGGCDNGRCHDRSHGAVVAGTFNLKAGRQLKILVGQMGGQHRYQSSGGGGGTFVTYADNDPLIVAGGGGGIEKLNQGQAVCSGTARNEGNRGFGGQAWPGGRNGQGASTADSGNSGGGGGGLLTDGRSSAQYGGSGNGGEGGKAFVNGGAGGRTKFWPDAQYNTANGGFGGGGGAYGNGGGAGGGGGYSGGASGDNVSNSCGGGGGSYNAGTDQTGIDGENEGHGYVVLTRLE